MCRTDERCAEGQCVPVGGVADCDGIELIRVRAGGWDLPREETHLRCEHTVPT